MVDVFLERDFEPPVGPPDLLAAWRGGQDCARLYRVEWHGSLLSLDGRKLVCHLRAPDAESARFVLRTGGADVRRMWRGTLHDAPQLGRFAADSANVMVRRSFTEPVALEAIQAIESAGAACLEVRHVKFVRTYFSADRKRMLCLYRAPDAESVREAQRYAGVPMDDVWGFNALLPD
jgi:uncharacterized protein DUF4242